MSHDAVFLSPEAKVEPLVARWYAWPHLVSPMQLGLNLEHRYLPLLRSFLANTGVHEAAARDPELFCGPYVGAPASRRDDVARLEQETASASEALRRLAVAFRQAETRLPDQARGARLDEVYLDLPAELRGLIELAYDGHGRPGMRLFEELLYRDPAAATEPLQALSIVRQPDTARRFFLNTPRLPEPGRMDLETPFRSRAADILGSMRNMPTSFADACRELELDAVAAARFRTFVTPEPPVRDAPEWSGPGVRIRYFGHACVLVQTEQTSILFDPVTAFERDCPEAALTFNDLPDRIDYVFLTHNHQDHISLETLLQLRARIGRILTPRHNPTSAADPSLPLMFRAMEFGDVEALDPLSARDLPGGRFVTLPFLGEHADLDIQSKHGLFLELHGLRMLFLADSRCLDVRLYDRLAGLVGEVDLLFIGMECHGAPLSWLYGPYLAAPPSRRHDESRRLSGSDSERAWSVIEAFGRPQVFVYAMGQEPWLQHILGLAYAPDSVQIVESDRLVERARAAGLSAERLRGCCDLRLQAAPCLAAAVEARP